MSLLPILFFLFRILNANIALSQVTLLLPTASTKYNVQHLLEATGGCAEWTVSNENVAELIKPTSDKCKGNYARAMWVVPRWTQKIRKSTHIKVSLKKDPNTWAECQVFVDQIDSIEIHTSTKVVYVGEVEDLRVLAKDSKENVFSTVSGLPLEWNDMSAKLQTLSIEEAKLDLDSVLEYTYAATDHVPICGKEVGKQLAHVYLPKSDANPKAVQYKADIFVVVKLQMSSEDLLLFPGCKNTLGLFSVKSQNQCQKRGIKRGEKRRSQISMPSSTYSWYSSREDVAKVDIRGEITAVGEGEECEIFVKDSNFDENRISTSIHVRVPKKIFLTLDREEADESSRSQNSDADTWYLTAAHKYVVTIDLYDSMGNRFDTCENQEFIVTLDDYEPVSLLGEVRQHRFADLNAKKVGHTWMHVKWRINEFELELDQKLQITAPLVVSPPQVVLPCTGQMDKWYGNFEVTGGSGLYEYQMIDQSLAEVRRNQVIMARTKVGETEMYVYDQYERANFGTVGVQIVGDIELNWKPGTRDVEVGGELTLYLSVQTKDRLKFANTQLFKDVIRISSTPEGITVPKMQWLDRDTSPTGADFAVSFTGTTPGIKDIFATIRDTCSGGVAQTKTKIQVYDDLTVSPSEVVMGAGSCATLTWMGGPEQFEGRSVDATAQPTNPGGLRIESFPKEKSYRIHCVTAHEQELTLSVSSRQGNTVVKKVKVKCFPELALKSPIELGIGEKYQLQLPSWLENNKEMLSMLHLKMDDENISKLYSSNRELVGKRTGRTVLQAKIDHYSIREDNAECPNRLQSDVDVVVAFRSFTLTTPQQGRGGRDDVMTMYQDSEIFLHVEGSNNEAPDSPSFAQVEVTWRVEGDCVELRPVFGPDEQGYIQHVGMRVYGRSIGQCMIRCNIVVNGPTMQTFASSVTMNVIDLYQCPCSTVVVAPNAEIDLHEHFGFTRQMTYTCDSGALNSKGNGVLVGTADAPRDESVRVQERSSSTSDVNFLTFSVRKPGGVTFSPNSKEPFCVGDVRKLQIGLYDSMGRNFTSLVGWSNEVLSEILNIRVQDRQIADARKQSVRNKDEAALVATVTLTANQVGTTLVHIGMKDIVPVYLTVRVAPMEECAISYLRVKFYLAQESNFHTVCSDVAAKVFVYDIADALGLDNDDIIPTDLDLLNGIFQVSIKSSGRDEDLKQLIQNKYSSIYYSLNLQSSLPRFEWTANAGKTLHNVCPADEQDTSKDYYEYGDRRRRASEIDADEDSMWNSIKYLLKIILVTALFFVLNYYLCTWWGRRIESFKKRKVQDLNAEQGPNSRIFEYQRNPAPNLQQNQFYNGGGIQSPNSFY